METLRKCQVRRTTNITLTSSLTFTLSLSLLSLFRLPVFTPAVDVYRNTLPIYPVHSSCCGIFCLLCTRLPMHHVHHTPVNTPRGCSLSLRLTNCYRKQEMEKNVEAIRSEGGERRMRGACIAWGGERKERKNRKALYFPWKRKKREWIHPVYTRTVLFINGTSILNKRSTELTFLSFFLSSLFPTHDFDTSSPTAFSGKDSSFFHSI